MVYGALAFGFLLFGLATRSGAIVSFAAVFVAYLSLAVLRDAPAPQLAVSRALGSRRVGDGSPVEVTVSVENTGGTLPTVVLIDTIPYGLSVVSGSARFVTPIAAGETVSYTYTVTGKRGRYAFNRITARSYGFGGVRSRIAEFPVHSELTSLPPRRTIESIPLSPRKTLLYHGPIHAGIPGEGTEFFDVREYAVGDPMRRINWRATARHENRLFTTDFERERITEIGIIVDGRAARNPVSHGVSLFEYTVAAAASLSDSLLSAGHRVGLVTIGVGLDWTFPGYGKKQAEKIYTALANASEGESAVFDALDSIPTRVLPAGSQVVIVSPVRGDDVRALSVMVARGYSVLVVRPDPESLAPIPVRPVRAAAIASRLQRIDRVLTLRELERVGVPVVSWDIKEPLEACIRSHIPKLRAWRLRGGAI
ncbi:MAG: DUF58 domain-containing protein [Spirochaetaceae bacterium]|nr:MAG: DUF58 domain-containing protein [Spirochaetaceae bacterium]